MHRIKSVGVMSVAKVMGLIYGALGLLIVPILPGDWAGVIDGDQSKHKLRQAQIFRRRWVRCSPS